MNENPKIKYIGYYDIFKEKALKRNYSMAATKKMDYITESLLLSGFKVEIISASEYVDPDAPFTSQQQVKLSDDVELILPPNFGAKRKWIRFVRHHITLLWLLVYLLKNCKKYETILVYHSCSYMAVINLAKCLKKLDVILEIEEQYGMVWKSFENQKEQEKKYLKKYRNGCIVVSEVLEEMLEAKNAIVSYGNYSVYQGTIAPKGIGDTINMIYTGSIDTVKGSAFMAIELMEFLPANYVLTITGYIARDDRELFYSSIESMNKKLKRNAVNYRGVLNDDEYSNLLKSADMALNPQKEGEFGQYLFPSKLLVYLSYNIPVVSTKGESIVKSKVAPLIKFAEEFSPMSMAKAILSVDFKSRVDSRLFLEQMSVDFRKQLKKRIQNVGS